MLLEMLGDGAFINFGFMVSGTTAAAIGVAALLAAASVGTVAATGGFDEDKGGEDNIVMDTRVEEALVETGALTEGEAQSTAKKRAFRSGVLFTSPTGLDSDPRTSSAKLR